MPWRIGRFTRGTIDEDVSGGSGIDTDAVFDPDRIAEALAAVVAGEPVPTDRSGRRRVCRHCGRMITDAGLGYWQDSVGIVTHPDGPLLHEPSYGEV